MTTQPKTPIIHNGDHAEYEIENAGKPPEERSDWPLPSFDARDWARAFLKTYDTADDDFLCEETMIGWFANALMRGYDERSGRDHVCSTSHPEIRYQGETCPLCEAKQSIGLRYEVNSMCRDGHDTVLWLSDEFEACPVCRLSRPSQDPGAGEVGK